MIRDSAIASPSLPTVVPAHSASKTRLNALMLGTHIPETVIMGPRNGVPATHSASQTRVNTLLLVAGTPLR